ncbi:methyl-accepting chemotaxis protein [Novosphingobium sp. SG720]|uniref:methyl-accepting chemotaxis protein n=1 Tax=Novosphingobium sp. SG720 TaxID=2586998 RepID=UPI001445C0F9|nr:methyl-accepting chemotaxis protein [Novosphingobium sp. SG720]NKJ40784.1 methyl-accepting chemotaxis protein [Novosphingobium sp. SG720]
MSFAKPASIRQSVMMCVTALVGICLVQIIASTTLQVLMQAHARHLATSAWVLRMQMYGDMKHDASESDVFRIKDAVARNDPAAHKVELANFANDIAALEKSYAQVFAAAHGRDEQALFTETETRQKAYAAAARALVEQIDSANTDLRTAQQTFTDAFDAFQAVQDKLGAQMQVDIAADGEASQWLMEVGLALTGLLVVLLGATVVWVVRHVRHDVVQPLSGVTTMLRAMASGDYSQDIAGDPMGSEVAQIEAAAAVFRQTALSKRATDAAQEQVVGALAKGLDRMAARDLEYRISEPFAPDFEPLRATFNQTQATLAGALGSVRVGASSLARTVREISGAAEDLAQRNVRQAATLEETAAAVQQVTTGVRDTAARAGDVSRQVEQAHKQASEGGEVVTRAVGAMAAIEGSSQEISQIIGVIDGIAFQTNLLALNAGVEAARAGDAGKGFAVVATEVRALAQRSADAAKDIKELIAKSGAHVADGVALVRETGEILGQILERVGDINRVVADISGTVDGQAHIIGQVNDAVGEMDRATQQNAAMVEETSAATRALAAEAGKLSELVGSFRTRNVETRAQGRPEDRRDSLSGVVIQGTARPVGGPRLVRVSSAEAATPVAATPALPPPPAPPAPPPPTVAKAVGGENWDEF